MSRRRGELTPRRLDRDWPHQVEILIPPVVGLGERFDLMHRFCMDRQLDYRTRSVRRAPPEPDAVRWCFRSADDAELFRDIFAQPSG